MRPQKQNGIWQLVYRSKKKRASEGFTLVELIVVIAIIGILASAVIPLVSGYVQDARTKVNASNEAMVKQAARLYLADQSEGDLTKLAITSDDLVSGGYLTSQPEGIYNVTFAKQGKHYTVTVSGPTKRPETPQTPSE